jgi:predicted dehydrogenase
MLEDVQNGSESEETDPLRVGVVGAGWISSVYHVPILAALEETSVEYVADIDRTRAADLARAYGAQAIGIDDDASVLPDSDVALLAVPVGVRPEYVDLFAERDTAVFCEKPFATTPADHERFLETTDAMFANYQRTCYSAVNQLRDAVKAGLFGDLERATVYEGVVGGPDKGIGRDHYRTDVALSGGGVLVEIGCHTLSELVHVFDDAEIDVADAEVEWNEAYDTDVDATLTVRDGWEAEIDYRVSSIRNLGKRATFVFENAVVSFDPWDPEVGLTVEGRTDRAVEYTVDTDDRWAGSHHQGVALRWRQFVADLRNEETRDHVRTAPEVTALIDEIYGQADENPRERALA